MISMDIHLILILMQNKLLPFLFFRKNHDFENQLNQFSYKKSINQWSQLVDWYFNHFRTSCLCLKLTLLFIYKVLYFAVSFFMSLFELKSDQIIALKSRNFFIEIVFFKIYFKIVIFFQLIANILKIVLIIKKFEKIR